MVLATHYVHDPREVRLLAWAVQPYISTITGNKPYLPTIVMSI
jgi:hypothetical protein